MAINRFRPLVNSVRRYTLPLFKCFLNSSSFVMSYSFHLQISVLLNLICRNIYLKFMQIKRKTIDIELDIPENKLRNY
jgi:hypothetical protein